MKPNDLYYDKTFKRLAYWPAHALTLGTFFVESVRELELISNWFTHVLIIFFFYLVNWLFVESMTKDFDWQ